ncbi:MAG: phosphatase PAP2 family protein [Ruminococcaceae bacterium]|nr:phosphatase PAP2 family protein [Oscillospiraceae bacterium]
MKKTIISCSLLLIPFLFGLFVAVNDGIIYPFEKAVFDLLSNLRPAADYFFIPLTELGGTLGLISVVAVVLVVSIFTKQFFTVGLPAGLVALISRIVNVLAKALTDRPRPDFKTLEVSETSFPSGHSQNNMAFYIALLICLLLVVTAPKWRVILKAVLIALPVLIGISRIYLGVHYISDVIAGWSIGAIVAIVFCFVYFKIYNNIKEKRNAKNRVLS